MDIKAEIVKQLRDKTGAGMMDCKKALTECSGDLDKATNWLREKGIAKAVAKSDRETKEGKICSYLKNHQQAVLIEMNCETDFVANTDQFEKLCQNLARHIAEHSPSDVNTLLTQKYFEDQSKSVQEVIAEAVATIGENIQVGRFIHEKIDTSGSIFSYIHSNHKIGVLVCLQTDSSELLQNENFISLGKDIAMHIAATGPLGISSTDIDPAFVESERIIYRNKAINDGKPADKIDMIVEGQVKKLYKEVCLLEQEFVKEANKSVQELIQATASKIGLHIQVVRFSRLLLGQ